MVPRLARVPGFGFLWRERWWLAAFVALLTFCRLPNVDGWDDAFYVGQLTSLLGDGDLRLQDDVVLVPKPLCEKDRVVTTVLPSGALANTFSVGPGLVLTPFTLPFVSKTSPPPWLPFRAASAFGAMSLLVLTAFVAVRVVGRLGVSAESARLATGLALLGCPLAVYATRSSLNAHAWGGLLLALVLHQALVWVESGRPRNAVALGLAAGLACVDRWQDAVVVAPIVALAIAHAARSARPWQKGAALVAVAGSLAVACQLLAWWIQFGTPFLIPQGGAYMHWLSPALVPLVFSSYHGLVPWAPALALGLVALGLGLARDRPRGRWLVLGAAVGSALALYVSACPEDWWGRDSFGPRRLASLAPAAAIGLGFLLDRLRPRLRLLLALGLGLWSVVAVSAHLSGHDDLLLLLSGHPDPFRPAEAASDSGAPAWINSWGALHALKPGFSLSDAPRLKDRIVGIACVALIVTLMRTLLPLLASRAWAQRVAVGLGLLVVGAWLALLARAPSNRAWDAQWKAFLAAPLDPVISAGLPAEMDVARDVVVSASAAERQDASALTRALDRLRARGVVASAADAARCRAPR